MFARQVVSLRVDYHEKGIMQYGKGQVVYGKYAENYLRVSLSACCAIFFSISTI